MSKNIKDLYLIIMYILAFVGVVIISVNAIDKILVYLLFLMLWIFSFSLRTFVLYNSDNYRKFILLTYVFEIGILFLVNILGAGSSIRLLVLLSLADCCIFLALKYGVICLSVILIGYFISNVRVYSFLSKSILETMLRELPLLIIAGLVAYLIGRVLESSELLGKTIKDVEEREVKLRVAYEELGSAYKSLEEMIAIKERNRIAREIHDTVGHTLTTVIVEMEAGKMISGKDPVQSAKKYVMAQEQAVKALNELRSSVKMLSSSNSSNLKSNLLNILEESSIHSDIIIKHSIEISESTKTPFDNLIIRILKECISNSLRHGKSTALFFKINILDNKLKFLLQDNGIGCKYLIPGFGIKNMKESIEQVGGCIDFTTELGEGFETNILLPLRVEEV